MNKKNRIYRSLFITSIIVLLINDMYLKYEYHNYITGKLSDFAGIFAFPYFFSSFLPKKSKSIYIFSGILFIFWKSEYSQIIIDFANLNGIGVHRTVDYSDLIALLILPFSYNYWISEFKLLIEPQIILKILTIGTCCFSFIATTLPRFYKDIRIKSDFETQKRIGFKQAKEKMSFYESSQKERYIYHILIPNRKMSIQTKIIIQEKNSGILNIKLDSILSYTVRGNGFLIWSGINEDDVNYGNSLTKKEIESLFETQLNKQVQ